MAERIAENRNPPVLAVLGSAVEDRATLNESSRNGVDIVQS